MKKGQIIYFYYDSVIPCQKGRIENIGTISHDIRWLDENNRTMGSSDVPIEIIFESEQECLSYHKSIENAKKEKLRTTLLTQKDILKYMYDAIYSEDYDWISEKEVLKEKIVEIFGLDVTADGDKK